MEKVKEAKKIMVGAGTFPAMCGNLAKSRKEKIEAAGLRGFSVSPAKDKGYICVAKAVEGQEEADKLIQEGAKQGISLNILV